MPVYARLVGTCGDPARFSNPGFGEDLKYAALSLGEAISPVVGVSAPLVASVVLMVVLVLMAALVPSVPVAPPFPVMLACSRGSGRPLNAVRRYDTHAPSRAHPDEQGEHN